MNPLPLAEILSRIALEAAIRRAVTAHYGELAALQAIAARFACRRVAP